MVAKKSPALTGRSATSTASGEVLPITCPVLSPAGLKTGQVIGKTSPDAVEVAERPVSAGDFFATICKALEIDHEGTYDVDGRPVPYTNTGSEPIAELF